MGARIGMLVTRVDPGIPTADLVARTLVGLVMVAALTGCSGAAAPTVSSPTQPPVAPASVAPATRTAAPKPDLAAMWRLWQQLNGVCRGGPPPGVDPSVDRACVERDAVMKEQAFASATAFLDAWRARDTGRLRELTHPDNGNSLIKVPQDLLRYTPTETAFGDCVYDMRNTGVFGCYMKVRELGTSLYVSWQDDPDKGWLVGDVAPDV